ncbi:MAG: hypothetical protein LBD77_11970, partial [Bifidobacteriaceae bacterium]|nr:hypothetical protein [Bifidobacteriaceae bacterium]
LGLDASARADYAGLLEHAAGVGNIRSGTRGGLPEGYVPLTPAQAAQTEALATALRAASNQDPEGVAPDPDATGGAQPPSGGASGAQRLTAAAPAAGVPDAGSGGLPTDPAASAAAQVTTNQAAATAVTAAAAPAAQNALGISLSAGLAGLTASPFLLRRRPAEPL